MDENPFGGDEDDLAPIANGDNEEEEEEGVERLRIIDGNETKEKETSTKIPSTKKASLWGDDDDDDDDNNAHRWRANAHPMRHARADARRCDAKKDGE